jgi:F-type H+-transporting ATPase subunit delta
MYYMQAASRSALAQARDRLNGQLDDVSESEAQALGGELFAAVDVLLAEVSLRRHLADPASATADRARLLQAVFGRSVGRWTFDVLAGLVGSRWSRPRDLVDSAEMLGQLALFAVAQKQGVIEDVEDELFRMGRLVGREPRLRTLLADLTVPAQRRVELMRSVISGKVRPVTERLLVRAIESPQGRSLDRAAEELAELAAASRERSVAKVSTPVGLTDEQQRRLTDTLSRIYRRPISLQVDLRPELVGGLVVRVGDEVIDGSIAGHLAAARQRLPH